MDTHHHSSPNLLWIQLAVPWESTTFWPLWCVLLIRVQTKPSPSWFLDIWCKQSRHCLTTVSNTLMFVNNAVLFVVFSTLFSVFGNMVRHGLSCLIYYFIIQQASKKLSVSSKLGKNVYFCLKASLNFCSFVVYTVAWHFASSTDIKRTVCLQFWLNHTLLHLIVRTQTAVTGIDVMWESKQHLQLNSLPYLQVTITTFYLTTKLP